jgi:hypothetical protein
VAEGKRNLKCVCKTHGKDQCPVHAPMDEGAKSDNKNKKAKIIMSGILKGLELTEVNPNNYDSDWDYQDAVAKSGRPRSRSSDYDAHDAENDAYEMHKRFAANQATNVATGILSKAFTDSQRVDPRTGKKMVQKGVAEGSEDLVQIEYWQQETMESGRWVKTKPMPRATAEKIVNSFERGEIVDVEQGVAEVRMSAAQRLSSAWDKQRAKSDASLRRTPSSIPKSTPEPKKPDTGSKTVSESRVKRRALMAQMLNNR